MRSLGFDNSMETMRILDIAMNPNSLFIDRKRSVNSHVSVSCREYATNACMHENWLFHTTADRRSSCVCRPGNSR